MVDYNKIKVNKIYKTAVTGDLLKVLKIYKGLGIADQNEFVLYEFNGKKHECALTVFSHCVNEL